jgi:beta-glucosidase/6-phospho-beta-glucosidase/beta-galactosidase
MMQNLGIKNFRLSLSWSRLLPNGTNDTVNQAGLDFYNNVINNLTAAGITPWVTLYHWDLPSKLNGQSNSSGWLDPKISDYFNDYADYCFSKFGDRVKHWLTLNEPWTYVWMGYGSGVHAPGRCTPGDKNKCLSAGGGGNTATEPYTAAHNSILAHGKAVQTYRTKY